MDIGSAVGRELGITEEQLRDLPRYHESEVFSEEERLTIELAVEMVKSPVRMSPRTLEEVVAALRRGPAGGDDGGNSVGELPGTLQPRVRGATG